MGGPHGPPISLPPRETAILREISIPHSEGLWLSEIAAELRISPHLVSRLLREFGDEVASLSGS
jgi:hypothetical protein